MNHSLDNNNNNKHKFQDNSKAMQVDLCLAWLIVMDMLVMLQSEH